MTSVETMVSISIDPQGMTLEALEAEIGAAVQQAGRRLLKEACRAIEAEVLQHQPSALRRCKQRSLHLLTRFGWIRLSRWQMRDAAGSYSCPLDAALGLQPPQHASPWIIAQAVALATRLPYRQATLLLGGLLDESLDHRTLHRWLQQAGARIVAEQDHQQTAVFVHGEIPPRDVRQREIVLAEVDGTFLRAQREEGPEFEVRLGVLTSGKALESPTARHRRYRLLERVRYGGVESARDFGERLFLAGEARLGLSHAQHLLLVGDGADWVEALAGHNRWRATYQLDWWHLKHAFHRTFPQHPILIQELKRALHRRRDDEILRLIRIAKATGIGDPQRVDNLLTYVQANRQGFHGASTLRAKLSDQAKAVCVYGSGAVEKHIDLVICRRFKGQGTPALAAGASVRWTRRGANHLLKLRLAELDRAA